MVTVSETAAEKLKKTIEDGGNPQKTMLRVVLDGFG